MHESISISSIITMTGYMRSLLAGMRRSWLYLSCNKSPQILLLAILVWLLLSKLYRMTQKRCCYLSKDDAKKKHRLSFKICLACFWSGTSTFHSSTKPFKRFWSSKEEFNNELPDRNISSFAIYLTPTQAIHESFMPESLERLAKACLKEFDGTPIKVIQTSSNCLERNVLIVWFQPNTKLLNCLHLHLLKFACDI